MLTDPQKSISSSFAYLDHDVENFNAGCITLQDLVQGSQQLSGILLHSRHLQFVYPGIEIELDRFFFHFFENVGHIGQTIGVSSFAVLNHLFGELGMITLKRATIKWACIFSRFSGGFLQCTIESCKCYICGAKPKVTKSKTSVYKAFDHQWQANLYLQGICCALRLLPVLGSALRTMLDFLAANMLSLAKSWRNQLWFFNKKK